MPLQVTRKNIFFTPDSKRVLARYFHLSTTRTEKLVRRILAMDRTSRESTLRQALRNFSQRHRSITDIWERNFKRTVDFMTDAALTTREYSAIERLLIGAYFTREYSIEAAAFFNPSIVEDPDQSELCEGEKRIILSFRSTGEGHVSSIVFRSAVIDRNLDVHLGEVGAMLEKPRRIKNYRYQFQEFLEKIKQIHTLDERTMQRLRDKFSDSFTYEELRRYISELREEHPLNWEGEVLMNQILWLASSHYEMTYSLNTSLSERVIFPVADAEKNGIEDARFVRFLDDKGRFIYFATYTAYDGVTILPKLLSTKDFIHFKVQPINGNIANKGAALFPRKIKGKYAMLCRVDGECNYIAFSDNLVNWHEEVTLIQEPEDTWELVQLGNCGSPLETPEGWLVLTHSVGPMRQYTLGALLLDLENPAKVIGRLKQPLLVPNREEREGYVPNVVYSCGQMIHEGHVIIPYAMSDHASTYATVPLRDLLDELLDRRP